MKLFDNPIHEIYRAKISRNLLIYIIKKSSVKSKDFC